MTPRQRFLTARFAYVAIVLLATLTGLNLSANLVDASMRFHRAFELSLGWRDAIDGLRNAVLFAGMGAVWVTTSLTGNIRREIRVMALTAFLLSMTVEGLQVFSPVRVASIVDVTTNTLGGPAGAMSAAWIIIFVRKARENRSYFRVPAMLLAAPYAAAVLCEALTPLFYSEVPAEAHGSPLARFAASLRASLPIEWHTLDVFDVPLFAAAGALLVVARRERRGAGSHPWLSITVLGSLALLAAHLAHGFLGLPIRWDGIITDVAALAVGALVADRWFGPFTNRYRGASRARAMIVAYVALLVLWGWRPFLLETRADAIMAQLDLAAFIPLSGLGDRVDSFSVFHVVQQFALYVPLGALLAVWPFRASGWRSSLWPAIMIALVIEVGHIFVVSRTFDMTNALLTSSGLAFGWTVVRRCGYQPILT